MRPRPLYGGHLPRLLLFPTRLAPIWPAKALGRLKWNKLLAIGGRRPFSLASYCGRPQIQMEFTFWPRFWGAQFWPQAVQIQWSNSKYVWLDFERRALRCPNGSAAQRAVRSGKQNGPSAIAAPPWLPLPLPLPAQTGPLLIP